MDAFDLRPLPERLAEVLAGDRPEVLDLVATEHGEWHGLHDRLIAIIVALLDDAVDRGEALAPLLERVIAGSSVGVDELVGSVPTPESVAALLRSHHSIGTADVPPEGPVTFVHDCGTGLAHWRRNPQAATVGDGDVPGVPGGVPRYCARCIATIDAVSGTQWRVRPPTGPDGRCRWVVERPEPTPPPGSERS